jgi:hypothetical protein
MARILTQVNECPKRTKGLGDMEMGHSRVSKV